MFVLIPGASSLTCGHFTLSLGCGEHYWLSQKQDLTYPDYRGIVTPAWRSAEKPHYHRAGTAHHGTEAAASAGQPAGATGYGR